MFGHALFGTTMFASDWFVPAAATVVTAQPQGGGRRIKNAGKKWRLPGEPLEDRDKTRPLTKGELEDLGFPLVRVPDAAPVYLTPPTEAIGARLALSTGTVTPPSVAGALFDELATLDDRREAFAVFDALEHALDTAERVRETTRRRRARTEHLAAVKYAEHVRAAQQADEDDRQEAYAVAELHAAVARNSALAQARDDEMMALLLLLHESDL